LNSAAEEEKTQTKAEDTEKEGLRKVVEEIQGKQENLERAVKVKDVVISELHGELAKLQGELREKREGEGEELNLLRADLERIRGERGDLEEGE